MRRRNFRLPRRSREIHFIFVATQIHPTAVIEPGAQLGADCEIQAYAVVTRHVQLGDRCVVYSHAVIGGDPQFLKFDRRTPTGVEIGADTVLREFATVNRAIHEGASTRVGRGCFVMTGAHVAHDCTLGNSVVLANNVLLAGHVAIADFCFLGGGSVVHQFTRIGEGAMVGGGSRVSRDIAPFVLASERDDISGLNLVGLRRRGVSRESIRELKDAYRAVFQHAGNIRDLAGAALASGRFGAVEAKTFLEFFAGGKRSFARPGRLSMEEQSGDE